MPELLLHIGTHKTGTTSIQRFCSANREALRKAGVWYPNASVGPFAKHYAHHGIAHAIAGRDQVRSLEHVREFFSTVRKKLKTGERCLISAEPLYRHSLPAADSVAGVKPTQEQRADEFARYVSAVRECVSDFDVTVMVMVRRQDLFAESLYAEHLLATGYVRGIEQFIAERSELMDYEARLGTWADVFGDENVSVRLFERSKLTSSIEQVFTEWLGLEWSDSFALGQRHNVTPTRAFVEFKRRLNVPGQDPRVQRLHREWVERMAGRPDLEAVPNLGRFYLQPKDRTELIERFADGNASVAQRFGLGDRLFHDDVADEIAKYEDRPLLSDADVVLMARSLAHMIAEEQVAGT